MKKTYFAKVSDSMSWDMLKEKIAEQKRNGAQPLPFEVVAQVNVSSKDFDKLSLSVGKANALYSSYTTLSIATSEGEWNCILIRCCNDPKNILVYTAGNSYPLYASIIK